MNHPFDLGQYATTISPDELGRRIADEFHQHYSISVGELLIHPELAIDFCKTVRDRHGVPHVPDDVILRLLIDAAGGETCIVSSAEKTNTYS